MSKEEGKEKMKAESSRRQRAHLPFVLSPSHFAHGYGCPRELWSRLPAWPCYGRTRTLRTLFPTDGCKCVPAQGVGGQSTGPRIFGEIDKKCLFCCFNRFLFTQNWGKLILIKE